MAEFSGEETTGSDTNEARTPPIKRVETQYWSTARTAPRAAGQSRIGTDEAHQRLQEARNRAHRDSYFSNDFSADQ